MKIAGMTLYVDDLDKTVEFLAKLYPNSIKKNINENAEEIVLTDDHFNLKLVKKYNSNQGSCCQSKSAKGFILDYNVVNINKIMNEYQDDGYAVDNYAFDDITGMTEVTILGPEDIHVVLKERT